MTTSLFKHYRVHLHPDAARTVIRPFDPEYPTPFRNDDHPRVRNIVEHILELPDKDIDAMYAGMVKTLEGRHRKLDKILERRFHEVSKRLPICEKAKGKRQLVIGSYFSAEYSFEAAALFNPSIVKHPRFEDDGSGKVHFLMTLRGIGEGHISSVTFREGSWSAKEGFIITDASPQAISPKIEHADDTDGNGTTSIVCEGSEDVSESVLFPVTPHQSQGIEDMRMCRFVDDDGMVDYYATYTAFNGHEARSELLRGTGFKTFEMRPLTGSAAAAKGMALFPRRIGGQYVMLARQDNESIWLLRSDDLYHWEGGDRIISPHYPWDFVQMGNCGSPVEIDEGWLVLTHGVGMVRAYAMGAALLDKKNPSKVLARSSRPILRPSSKERDGYVPNVVYSCGAMVHDRTLLLPYGVADNFTSFASCPIDKLLEQLE